MALFHRILCPKAEDRATIQEIETNKWVTQPVDMSLYTWEKVVRNTEFYCNNAGEFMDDLADDMPRVEVKPVEAKNIEKNIDAIAESGATVNNKIWMLSKSF